MEHLHHYIILDGAKMMSHLSEAIELNPTHRSLYLTEANDPLQQVAPLLFSYHHGNPFSHWCEKNGRGESWGTVFSSYKSFDYVYKHFRQHLFITTADNEKLYFRFYDPRVMRTFLPVCTKQQLLKFFGPIHDISCEDADSAYQLKFFLRNHELHTERRHIIHKPRESQQADNLDTKNLPAQDLKKNPWID
jgi:hypothetical protein